ncbi:MAG: hypothetical protein IKZ49_01780 [Alphaproteobacteria bacterium]|nr:hypothetical protein [Alphaproteobacteria bacterium]
MQYYKKNEFYSWLFFTELLCSGHTSESKKVYTFAKNTLNLAFEIIEDAVKHNKYALFQEIVNAAKNLDLSKKQTILSANQKELICRLYTKFEIRMGDLLEENMDFAYGYNCFLNTLRREANTKKKSK